MDNIDKKTAIFESTLLLIKEHGFQTPMSLIAKNASVAAGTIYHYFASKDDLISEMYQFNKRKIIEVIKQVLKEDVLYKDKFFKMWIAMYEFYTENTDVLIFFEQYINSPYNEKKNPDHLHDRPLHNFLVKGIKDKQIKSLKADILLTLFFGTITIAAKLHVFGNIRLEKTDLKNIIQILWDGIATPAHRADQAKSLK